MKPFSRANPNSRGMDTRRADLAAIHIAQKALGLDKDAAESLKLSVTGQASSAAMTAPQRRRYLAHLSSLQARTGGAAAVIRRSRAPVQRSDADEQDDRLQKARTLWMLLAREGHVHQDTDEALMAYVRRQTHADAWRFLNGYQINTVIESLKRWCLRVGVGIRNA